MENNISQKHIKMENKKFTVLMKYGKLQNYVGGQLVDASGARVLEVISPVDGALLATWLAAQGMALTWRGGGNPAEA